MLQATECISGDWPLRERTMQISGVEIMIMDQLTEQDIPVGVKDTIRTHIKNAGFKVASGMIGKAKEGVGGFRLVLMSDTLDKVAHTIEVRNMKPWD